MNQRISEHLRRNVYGLIAIFIALGGSAVAANVAKNSVTSKSIKNGQVKRKDLADAAVNGAKVEPDSLSGDQINESSLQLPAQVASGAAGGDLTGKYPNPQIAKNTVTAAEVVDATLTGADIADTNSLTTAEIDESGLAFSPGGQVTGTLGQALLAPSSVGPAEIADNAVGPGAIADNAVGPAEIADNAVGPTQIADNAVGDSEIADNAVRDSEIADNAVGSSEIAGNAVSAAQVVNRSLTLADVSSADTAIGNTAISTLLVDGQCTSVATGLLGAQVGDLVIVVSRSSDVGIFTPPVRVTTDGQFPLTMCNYSGSAILNPTANVDVFAMRP